MGLPGSGKTTLAKVLVQKLKAVHFNADAVRENINKDLGFGAEARLEQATRMGWLCNQVVEAGHTAVADFICPTPETRKAFDADITIWVDRIKKGRFEDTNKIFQPPKHYDVRLNEGTIDDWIKEIYDSPIACMSGRKMLCWDNKADTALLIGRYQPFHDGHKALVAEAIKRTGQCVIAIRDTANIDKDNPYNFQEVKSNILKACQEDFGCKVKVIAIPNVTDVFYGRGVGYNIEQIELTQELKDISATKIRKGKIDTSGKATDK